MKSRSPANASLGAQAVRIRRARWVAREQETLRGERAWALTVRCIGCLRVHLDHLDRWEHTFLAVTLIIQVNGEHGMASIPIPSKPGYVCTEEPPGMAKGYLIAAERRHRGLLPPLGRVVNQGGMIFSIHSPGAIKNHVWRFISLLSAFAHDISTNGGSCTWRKQSRVQLFGFTLYDFF